jgi:hypothetical protein
MSRFSRRWSFARLVGGRLAGILAAGVGGIIAWYLWLPPRGTFSLEWPTAQLTILLYVLTSTILLLLTRGLNETLKDLEKERDLSAELFRELQHRTAALVGTKLLAGPLFQNFSDRRYFDMDKLVDSIGNVPPEMILQSCRDFITSFYQAGPKQ